MKRLLLFCFLLSAFCFSAVSQEFMQNRRKAFQVTSAGNYGIVGVDRWYTNAIAKYDSPNTPMTFPHTNSGANRYVIVSVSISDNLTAYSPEIAISSITYGGTSMLLLTNGSPNNDKGGGLGAIYGLVNPTLGENTVSIQLNITNLNPVIAGAVSFTNVNQTTPISARARSTGNSTTASTSITVAANDMAFDWSCSGSPGTTTAGGTGHSEIWKMPHDGASGAGNVAAGKTTGSGSVTPTWTIPGDWWVMVAVTLAHD